MRIHSELLIVEFVMIFLTALAVTGYVLRLRSRRHVTNGGCPDEKHITIPELWFSFWRQVWSDILHGSPVVVIAATGVFTIYIGLHLINPTIETFGPGSEYGDLNRTWFGETTWGFMLFALGLGKLVLLAYNGLVRKGVYPATYYLAAFLNFAMSIIWANIAFGIIVSGSTGFGQGAYILLSFLSVWSASRRWRVARGGS